MKNFSFGDKRFWDVLNFPLMTEKAFAGREVGQYVFAVNSDVSKDRVKEAVEKIFSVEVLSVNALRVKGKIKAFRGRIGHRKCFKKVFVRLKSGYDLSALLENLS